MHNTDSEPYHVILGGQDREVMSRRRYDLNFIFASMLLTAHRPRVALGDFARLTPLVVTLRDNQDMLEVFKLNAAAFHVTSSRDAHLLAYRVQCADIDVPTTPIYAVRKAPHADKPTGIWVGFH